MTKPALHRIRIVLAIALGIPFIMIGVEHFLRPAPFDTIVPAYLGFPHCACLSWVSAFLDPCQWHCRSAPGYRHHAAALSKVGRSLSGCVFGVCISGKPEHVAERYPVQRTRAQPQGTPSASFHSAAADLSGALAC